MADRGKVCRLRPEVHGDLAEHDGLSEDGVDKRSIAEELVHSGEGEGEFGFDKNGPGFSFEDEVSDVEVLVSVPDWELGVEPPSVLARKASKPLAHFPLIAEPLSGGRIFRPRKRRRVGLQPGLQLPTVREGP